MSLFENKIFTFGESSYLYRMNFQAPVLDFQAPVLHLRTPVLDIQPKQGDYWHDQMANHENRAVWSSQNQRNSV